MRVFAILVLAVAASAVGLEHRSAATNHLEQQVQKTAFGQSVLAQLQAQVAAGAPLDELNDIIKEIRDRLTAAQDADTNQRDQYRIQCTKEINDLNTEIDNLKTKIQNLKADIAASEAEIVRLKDAIAAQKQKILFDESEIKRVNEALDANDLEWQIDHQIFLNRTRDTKLCLSALDEIKQIDGIDEILAPNQDEVAGDYQDSNFYTTLLQKAAKKVQAPSVKAFVQLTAAAVAQLDKGDVDSLKSLLDQLEQDLNNYLVELETDDKNNEKAYNEKKAALSAELNAAEDTLKEDKEHLARLQADLKKEEENLADLQAQLLQTQDDLRAKEAELAATEQKCKDLEEAYQTRSSERTEELKTLAEIERIINTSLKPHLDDSEHLNDRINNSGVTTVA